MINSYEVGSIFTIEDRGSAVLKEIAANFERIDVLIKSAQESMQSFVDMPGIATLAAKIGELENGLYGVAAASTDLRASFAQDFEAINAGLMNTVRMTRELAVGLQEVQVASAAMAAQTIRAGGGGGRRGGGGGEGEAGGFEEFGGGVAKGMGMAGLLTHPATFIAGLAAFHAGKEGAHLDSAIERSMVAMGETPNDDFMNTPTAQAMRANIVDASKAWGASLDDTGKAAVDAIRLLAPRSEEDRMKMLPVLLNFAGAETRGKPGTTMDEAVDVGVGLAHQLRDYSPEQIEPVLKQFAQLSMTTHASLAQFARASSYYLPLLNAGLGMDAGELMAIGTVGSQMGLNTKSGTWLAQLFQAPFVADLTGTRGKKRRDALQELGIVDDEGNVTTKDPLQFLTTLSEHAAKLTPEQRARDFTQGFGTQGARGASIYSDPAVLANITELVRQFSSARTVDALKTAYNPDPIVKMSQEMSAFNAQLATLGEAMLPVAILGLKALNTALMPIVALLNFPQEARDIARHTTEIFLGEKKRETAWEMTHPGTIPPPPKPPLPGFKFAPGAPSVSNTKSSDDEINSAINNHFYGDIHLHGVNDPHALAHALSNASNHNNGIGTGNLASPFNH